MRLNPLALSTLALLGAALPVADQLSLVPGTVNTFRDSRGANDVGIGAGERIQYGADIAGGSAGVTLRGTSATGFVAPSGPCAPLAVNANFCANAAVYDPSRTDPWTLLFTRGADSLTVTGPSIVGAPAVPFPTSVTLSGAGVTPTISWQIPASFTPDGFRVNIYDKGSILVNGVANVIFSTAIAANANSFTLPSGIGLTSTGNYAINFQVVDTRGHVAFTNNNAQILSRSTSFFDFAPLSGSVPHDVALPTIDSSGVYNFHVGGVSADHITFIDPAVATGYHYLTGAGDPSFQSVLLPNVGDGIYSLTYLDGSGSHTVSLLHDQQFFFGSGGVNDFTVGGIETSAGLDPSNPTAFITGLTFAGNGDFTGTMTPITELVAGVPEPETYALMVAGLCTLGALNRRRKQRT